MSEIEVTCPVCSHKFYEWPQSDNYPIQSNGRMSVDPVTGNVSIGGPDHSLQRALEAERQRIIEKNAPEIERINAWIDRDTALLRQALHALEYRGMSEWKVRQPAIAALKERLK